MFKIQTHHKAVVIAFFVLALSALSGGNAHAATITVNTDTNPSPCTLDEAIQNINDQADTNADCIEVGSYGTNDTIDIPSGTVTLAADLPSMTRSVSVNGNGMGETTIDGLGLYTLFDYTSTTYTPFTVTDMKITGLKFGAILAKGGGSSISFSRLDIDGNNADTAQTYFGLGVVDDGTFTTNVTIQDVYVHGFVLSNGNGGFQAITVANNSDENLSADFQNVTISDVSNDGLAQGLTLNANVNATPPGGVGRTTGTAENITIDNITSTLAIASGLGSVAFGIENTVILTASNVTISELHAITGNLFPGIGTAAIFAATAGSDNVLQPHATLNVSNAHITDSESCLSLDMGPLIGTLGTGLTTITSQGGNLTDDTTCTPFFTQPTDKHNLTNLKDLLAPLADNGGYVPTMALMQGSPAIDSGVTLAGLTTDARGSARPQGTAYDSGAYESPYSKTTTSTSTLANTGENMSLLMMASMVTLISSFGFVLFRKLHS